MITSSWHLKNILKTHVYAVKKVVKKIDKTYKCAKCKDGYLQPKDGQYGKFWGCSSYPECKTTHKDSNGTPVGVVITTKD